MKKYLICMLLLAMAFPLSAQRGGIDTDIFGDLRYESNGYNAALKKDIFDNLTFSDNNGNKVVYEKKYLELEHMKVLSNNDAKADFFRRLVREYRREKKYEAKFSVDIFGTVRMEDNRGNKVEKGTDIFGNPTYEESSGGVKSSVKRSLNGTLEYRSGSETASLGKDIFDKWTYKDSRGNKFEFGGKTWNKLIRRFGGDEEVFFFLIDEFLRD